MAKEKKVEKKVEQITDMEVDFAQWFTDVCKKAQLIDYSSIKGVFIYRPYGYAIWENIQTIMDKEFKKQGVENVYMPMLIPRASCRRRRTMLRGSLPSAPGSPMAAWRSWKSAMLSAPPLRLCSASILPMCCKPTVSCP